MGPPIEHRGAAGLWSVQPRAAALTLTPRSLGSLAEIVSGGAPSSAACWLWNVGCRKAQCWDPSYLQYILMIWTRELNATSPSLQDDTKLGGSVSCEEDARRLQGDLDRLGEWANAWQMQYNVDKCEVIHFGGKNRKVDYYLNGGRLGKGEMQRDLGVMVHQSLKVGMQVQQAVKKANGMLAFIAKGFEYRSREVLLQLYRVLVRPHLEYCVQFWSPNLRKDILAIEGVQRRFTRLIPGMSGLSYEERLDRLGLYSLEFRRLRGDLIETYKILKGLDRLDAGRLFPMLGKSRTRGPQFKDKGEIF